jgi:hypothetical protein
MSAPFSASRAGRHINCHASAHLELAIPNWTPPVVDDMAGAKGKGTTMHQLLEPLWSLGATDMAHVARVVEYVADVRSLRRFNVLIEEKMVADWLPSKPSTTADLVLYVSDEIHIIDFKWGKIPVEVFGNDQLLHYARTYCHLAPRAKSVFVHIVQPYADNFEWWEIEAQDLAAWSAKAEAADAAIQAGDITFGMSDHCKFCPAFPHSRGDKGKPLCPTAMAFLYPPIVHEDEILGL